MKVQLFCTIALLLVPLGCAGCASSFTQLSEEMTACPEIRPEVCTQEYVPVCARHENGDYQTYSNACSACADVKVVGYKPDACK